MKKSLFTLLVLSMSFATTGCSTVGKSFDNNVYCKIGESSAVAVSQWGPFGISANLANGDKICPIAPAASASSTK